MDATHWSGVCVVRVVITALAYGAAHTCISKCMWYMGCVSVWEHWAYEWLDARQERRTRTHTLRPASVKNEKHEERKAKWKKKTQIIRRMRRKSREIPFRCSSFLAPSTVSGNGSDVCVYLFRWRAHKESLLVCADAVSPWSSRPSHTSATPHRHTRSTRVADE